MSIGSLRCVAINVTDLTVAYEFTWATVTRTEARWSRRPLHWRRPHP
jgi:hypothetical protein